MKIISPHIIFNNLNKGPNYTKCQILSVFAEYSVIFGYFIILGVVGEFDEQKLKVNIPLPTLYIYIYAMQEVEYLLLFFVHQILPAPPKWWNTQKLLMYISWNLRWQLSWNFMQIETQLNNESSEISKNLFFLADSYLAGFQSQQVNKISVWLKKLKIFTKVSWIVLLPLKIKKKEFFKNITENLHFLNTNTESNKDRSLLCKIYYL